MAFENLEVYRHSGTMPPAGMALALGGSFVAAAILGWLYTEFLVSVPFIYLNLLAALALGYGSGAIASRLVHLGKIRQPDVPVALALTAAGWGLYVAWAHDIAARGLVQDAGFTLSVGRVWAYAKALAQSGSWSITPDGEPLSGALLMGVWLLEGCAVFGAAWRGAQDSLENAVFCEGCDRWTELERGVKQINRDAFDTLVPAIKAGDILCLASITADPGSRDHVRVDMASCPGCTEQNYVSVTAVTTRADSNGVERKTERRIVPPVRVPGQRALEFSGTRPWRAAGLRPAPAPDKATPTGAPAAEDPPFPVLCPHCGKTNRVPKSYAGRRGRCARCKRGFRIPRS